MTDQPPSLLPLDFSVDYTHQRFSHETAQISTKLPKCRIYNSTVPLWFETYPEDIYTIPLIPKHHDSYLYYLDTHSLVEILDSFNSFQLLIQMKPFAKTFIRPTLIFLHFMFSLHFSKPLRKEKSFTPTCFQSLSSTSFHVEKVTLFDFPNIKQLCTFENNPHHGLTIHILQIDHFQYQFFQNLTLNTHFKKQSRVSFLFDHFQIQFFQNLTLNTLTIEQSRVYSFFLRNTFKNNYQINWDSEFQDACTKFPSQFSKDELLPFLVTSDNCHPHFYYLRDFPVAHFTYLTYDIIISPLFQKIISLKIQNVVIFWKTFIPCSTWSTISCQKTKEW